MVIFEKHISEGRNLAFYFQEGVVFVVLSLGGFSPVILK